MLTADVDPSHKDSSGGSNDRMRFTCGSLTQGRHVGPTLEYIFSLLYPPPPIGKRCSVLVRLQPVPLRLLPPNHTLAQHRLKSHHYPPFLWQVALICWWGRSNDNKQALKANTARARPRTLVDPSHKEGMLVLSSIPTTTHM